MSYVQDALQGHSNRKLFYLLNSKPVNIKKRTEQTLQKFRTARLPAFGHPGILTKTPAEMSDEEYKKKIEEMARRDYKNGDWASTNPQYMKLKTSYIQVVSPDRRALFSKGLSSWAMGPNAAGQTWDTRVYDSKGNMVGVFDVNSGVWSATATPQEWARESEFNSIYTSAWRQAKAEHEGKLDASV